MLLVCGVFFMFSCCWFCLRLSPLSLCLCLSACLSVLLRLLLCLFVCLVLVCFVVCMFYLSVSVHNLVYVFWGLYIWAYGNKPREVSPPLSLSLQLVGRIR